MYSELIKRLRKHNDERLYLEADELMADGADALEAQAKEIAAMDLVIQQMREALQLPCDRWNAAQFAIVSKALALEPSTEALDAYVAEKVREKDAEITKLIEAVADHVTVRAEQYAELQKYRDAPVVWIHSGHLHQAMNQPFLCRVLPEQCEGYKHLIVKPVE